MWHQCGTCFTSLSLWCVLWAFLLVLEAGEGEMGMVEVRVICRIHRRCGQLEGENVAGVLLQC